MLTSCHRLVINEPISGWQKLVDDKSVAICQHADLLQVDCQNLLSTGLLQVVSTSYNKSANDKLQQA